MAYAIPRPIEAYIARDRRDDPYYKGQSIAPAMHGSLAIALPSIRGPSISSAAEDQCLILKAHPEACVSTTRQQKGRCLEMPFSHSFVSSVRFWLSYPTGKARGIPNG